MRLIRPVASVVLLVGTAVMVPTTATGLSCVRPWGTDELAGARMALTTEGFGAGDFDGFLIARVTRTAVGPSGRVSDIDLAVAVAFDVDVSPDLSVEVGPHGPEVTFQSGHTYFLTLQEATDPAPPALLVHPCGPAFEVSSSTELNFLLGLRDDETVVDGGYLSDLRQSLPQEGFLAVAGAALALVVVVGAFLLLWRRSRGTS